MENTRQGIIRAKPNEVSAEGGNRTLIPGGNTILSRARLPVPPLRQVCERKYTTLNNKVKNETRNYRFTPIRKNNSF